ncbi:MAG TPA: DUF488 family protein [Chloroflexota bacterium]|nr:DUF488 family protein [Chloroflexota bacterium]
MFTEGCVYAPSSPKEGLRVLVMRTWPRGVRLDRVDLWLKELGPTPDLLRGLGARALSWLAFENAYLTQLTTRAETIEAVAVLHDLETRAGTVALLCHERQPPCHRFVLLKWLGAG